MSAMINQIPARPEKLFSYSFLRSYAITMRPYLLFVSGITGIAGLSFAPVLSFPETILLAIIFFLSYGFGQALTDCFQIDTDSLSSPYRPLTQGLIQKKHVLAVSLAGLGLIGVILTAFNPVNLILATIAVLGLATYTWFKKRWWGGPFYNSWIVALLCLIAFAAGNGRLNWHFLQNKPFLFTLLTVFFGYANFVLSGYYKDVSADRATGYNTLPVVYGFGVSNLISDLFALITLSSFWLVLSISVKNIADIHWQALAILSGIIVSATLLIAQIRLHRTCSEQEAHRAIALIVHAYILLLTMIAILQKPRWSIALILFYLAFIAVMKFRPIKEQI